MVALGLLDMLPEEYVYIAETDHVFMKPLRNLATATTPVAFGFGYMYCSAAHQALIDRFSPGTSWRDVQPVGPSPLLVSKRMLADVAPLWYNLSLKLKRDKSADVLFGWVLEM